MRRLWKAALLVDLDMTLLFEGTSGSGAAEMGSAGQLVRSFVYYPGSFFRFVKLASLCPVPD
jgi:hypothetical protein